MTAETGLNLRMGAGSPHWLGAHAGEDGVDFAVFSENAEAVQLSLFSPDGAREEHRIDMPERTGPVWHGRLEGARPGLVYGYRVTGPYAPEEGHRFNPNKLLLDPYTRELRGSFTHHAATFGYTRGAAEADLSFDTRDSAPHVAKSVVSDPAAFPRDARRLGRGWDDAVIYEAHVRGATMLHPDVPPAQRGTYDGMASTAMLDHLTRLGVTAVELLPVQAIHSEWGLADRGLVNYWGYNTVGFFAPEPRYAGPSGLAGFRAMVERFHGAGIEVILDVVYNHSAEGDHLGPTLGFRGLDNAAYYRLIDGDPRHYVNDTGTGNTLNLSHPYVARMVLDSLRFWVEAMGIDGFRFDLGVTLAREDGGFDPGAGFLDALRQDPVLAGVKLIAEPWDVGPGGYRLGEFPPEFAEWNDRARDTVRRFWRGDAGSAQDLGSVLLGSANTFDRGGRRTWASVNFVAAHDGFTLADTTSYKERRNDANGEGNRDGHHANYSDNMGVEGETGDPDILAARARRRRNMLATVLLAQGTPMLLAGDEGGHSQGGNNNAYAQDNRVSWIDWAELDAEQIAFTAALGAFRRAHPVVRQTRFLHGAVRDGDGLRDVEWRSFTGGQPDWRDPELATMCLVLRGNAEAAGDACAGDTVVLAFNRANVAHDLILPDPGACIWRREIDTSTAAQSPAEVGRQVEIAAHSVAAFVLADAFGG